MKKKIFGLVFIIVLLSSFCGLVFAASSTPVLPTLELKVEKSAMDIYPPIMIFTAQLSFMPPSSSVIPKADFYNRNRSTGLREYLGSAPFDQTGKAVLSKQINEGYWLATASTVIYNTTIWSNSVYYRIP